MKNLINKATRIMICVGGGLVVTAGFVLVILDASNFSGF